MAKQWTGFTEDWLNRRIGAPEIKTKKGRPKVDGDAITELYKQHWDSISPRVHLVKIKPMSINDAWFGMKRRTTDHREYEKKVLGMLPEIEVGNPPYKVILTFAFSRTNADIDNPTKIILDLLTKKYGYDDRYIYELNIFKKIVKTGDEYFTFSIESI